ncbi:MAG: hypothetical protein M1550_04005 [Deltaproteobacteria bacterium]|nr:hypothetical protein [Deltaproteobacteria bacterium]
MSKRLLFGAAALGALLVAVPAFPEGPSMPVVEQRQENQQKRIGQGIPSGELTPRETIRLEREQAGIERAERRAEADGTVTPKERVRLKRKQDKASRDIYRLKHNRRKAE